MKHVLAVIVVVLIFSLHARAAVVFLPSELNARERLLEGETITVRGWLVFGPQPFGNEYGIWENKAAHDGNTNPAKNCVTLFAGGADFERLRQRSETTVQITGVFRRNLQKDERRLLHGACHRTGVVFLKDSTVGYPATTLKSKQ